MANTFDQAFQRAYNGVITTLAKAKGNKFLGYTREEMQSGESETYETLDNLIALSDDRTVLTSPQDWIKHGKRTVVQEDFIVNPIISKFDAKKTPVSFDSAYARATIKALNVKRDIKTIEGMLGDALGGKQATTVIPFDYTNNVIGVQVGGGGSNTGMNMDKLRALLGSFMKRGISVDDGITVAMTGAQLTELMADKEVTSSDFTNNKALVSGKLTNILGMNIITSEHLPFLDSTGKANLDWGVDDVPVDVDSTGIRACVAFAKESVVVGVNPAIDTVVSVRADLKNATQFMSTLGVGSTRLDDQGVQVIACAE